MHFSIAIMYYEKEYIAAIKANQSFLYSYCYLNYLEEEAWSPVASKSLVLVVLLTA